MMKKLLVVRNDKLGDLILILPALQMLKSSIEDIEIDCLLDEKYTDIKLITEYIDNTVLDSEGLVETLDQRNYDFSISFFSTFSISQKIWRSNIKKRYAPATKLAQFFHNKKIKQRRSLSIKPEYEYNNDLARYFLSDNSYKIINSNAPYLLIGNDCINTGERRDIVYIHPFTGGSSKTLSTDDFIELCQKLNKISNCRFVLHCDESDHKKCIELEKKASNLDIHTIKPTRDLVQMFSNINKCDLFIAGSTGPLHVAAALNKKTVGFYPSKTSSTLLRWDTINESKKKLSFGDTSDDKKYIKVNLDEVADLISRNLLNET